MRRMLILCSSLIVGLTMLIAQATTVGASPPFIAYQPKLPKALKKD